MANRLDFFGNPETLGESNVESALPMANGTTIPICYTQSPSINDTRLVLAALQGSIDHTSGQMGIINYSTTNSSSAALGNVGLLQGGQQVMLGGHTGTMDPSSQFLFMTPNVVQPSNAPPMAVGSQMNGSIIDSNSLLTLQSLSSAYNGNQKILMATSSSGPQLASISGRDLQLITLSTANQQQLYHLSNNAMGATSMSAPSQPGKVGMMNSGAQPMLLPSSTAPAAVSVMMPNGSAQNISQVLLGNNSVQGLSQVLLANSGAQGLGQVILANNFAQGVSPVFFANNSTQNIAPKLLVSGSSSSAASSQTAGMQQKFILQQQQQQQQQLPGIHTSSSTVTLSLEQLQELQRKIASTQVVSSSVGGRGRAQATAVDLSGNTIQLVTLQSPGTAAKRPVAVSKPNQGSHLLAQSSSTAVTLQLSKASSAAASPTVMRTNLSKTGNSMKPTVSVAKLSVPSSSTKLSTGTRVLSSSRPGIGMHSGAPKKDFVWTPTSKSEPASNRFSVAATPEESVRVKRMKLAVQEDQLRVLNSDTKSKFKSKHDAITRLTSYHVYYEPSYSIDELKQIDDHLESVALGLLQQQRELEHRFHNSTSNSSQLDLSCYIGQLLAYFNEDESKMLSAERKSYKEGSNRCLVRPENNSPTSSEGKAPTSSNLTSTSKSSLERTELSTVKQVASPQLPAPPPSVPCPEMEDPELVFGQQLNDLLAGTQSASSTFDVDDLDVNALLLEDMR